MHSHHDLPAEELSSAEANRRFYETHAASYDATESCAYDGPREKLRLALSRGIDLLERSPERALDAGGGTGNASMLLHEMGIGPTLIDASPEMITLWEEKARRAGIEPESEIADLETFFETDERNWDLIVFSSVLHHLGDPAEVLTAAAERLRPGGVIVTIFDPRAVDRFGHFLRRLDYGIWIAIHAPATLIRAIARRVGSRLRPSKPGVNVGALAERHAMSGLDDRKIRGRLEAAGMTVAVHEHIHDARYGWIVALARRTGQPTHFSFALQAQGGRRPGANLP